MLGQLLTALKQRNGLFEGMVFGFQSGDNRLKFGEGLFVSEGGKVGIGHELFRGGNEVFSQGGIGGEDVIGYFVKLAAGEMVIG